MKSNLSRFRSFLGAFALSLFVAAASAGASLFGSLRSWAGRTARRCAGWMSSFFGERPVCAIAIDKQTVQRPAKSRAHAFKSLIMQRARPEVRESWRLCPSV